MSTQDLTLSDLSDSMEYDENTINKEKDSQEHVKKPSNPRKRSQESQVPQEAVKRTRNSKKRSKIWNDFVEEELEEGMIPEDKKARCLHCGKKYLCHSKRYGNKNLKNHLPKCKDYLAKNSDSQSKITFEHGDTTKMMAWKFGQKESVRALAHMIIVDELPFSFVMGEGFRHFIRINQPQFRVPCRSTITRECFKLYYEEKNKIRDLLQRNIGRICVTTDTWTSIRKKSYMALTAHFIDNDWKLVKKVLNFCLVDGHRGVDIGKGVQSCLNEWGIDNVLTISVDNASANDCAIEFLKLVYANNHNSLLHGKWTHIRCAAHILNLVVQDGMKKVDKSIESIRCAVKWVKKSGDRIEKFNKCAESASCASKKQLILDIPTRWNSTYHMLDVAQAYEQAFVMYDLEDGTFVNYVRKKGHSVPTWEDWEKARKLCVFLKTFYEVTLKFSGTKYVTSHTLVVEIAKIRDILRQEVQCDIDEEPPKDKHIYDIAKVMKPKFDKYFGDIESINFMLYFALLLYPRNKEEFLDIILDDHYGKEGTAIVELKKTHIMNGMVELYDDYVRIHGAPIPPTTSSTSTNPTSATTSLDFGDRLRNKMKASQYSIGM